MPPQLQVQYKSFSDLDSEKSWWSLPSFTDLLQMGGMEGVYNKVFGEDGIKAGDFVRSTLGSLQFLLEDKEENTAEEKVQSSKKLFSEAGENDIEDENEIAADSTSKTTDLNTDLIVTDTQNAQPFDWFGFGKTEQMDISKENGDLEQDDCEGDYVRTVVQAVGKTLASLGVDAGSLPSFDRNSFQADGEAINKLSSEFQSKAEADYVENGLAISNGQITETAAENDLQVSGNLIS